MSRWAGELCVHPCGLPRLPQLRSLTPLHIAAALPGEEGVQITELLLQAAPDVDARAADQDDSYKPGKVLGWPRLARESKVLGRAGLDRVDSASRPGRPGALRLLPGP